MESKPRKESEYTTCEVLTACTNFYSMGLSTALDKQDIAGRGRVV